MVIFSVRIWFLHFTYCKGDMCLVRDYITKQGSVNAIVRVEPELRVKCDKKIELQAHFPVTIGG
jgi:hypothetical protein